MSRAGLVTSSQEGRARWLRVRHSPAQAWEHAAPFLRSPVKRTLWVDYRGHVKTLQPPLAGLSALASYSVLAEPQYPVYAVSPAQWKAAQKADVQVLPELQPQASQWQVWSYGPSLLKPEKTVDPLSLTLSLKDEQDDRVQQALEELRGQFPW